MSASCAELAQEPCFGLRARNTGYAQAAARQRYRRAGGRLWITLRSRATSTAIQQRPQHSTQTACRCQNRQSRVTIPALLSLPLGEYIGGISRSRLFDPLPHSGAHMKERDDTPLDVIERVTAFIPRSDCPIGYSSVVSSRSICTSCTACVT